MVSFIIPPHIQRRYPSISAGIQDAISAAYAEEQKSNAQSAFINAVTYFEYCKRLGDETHLSMLETINGKGPYRVYIDNTIPTDKVFILDGDAIVRITDVLFL